MPTIENYATKKLAANNEIMMYLNDNELSVSPDSLGLVYIPLKEGNSVFPKENDIAHIYCRKKDDRNGNKTVLLILRTILLE